MDQTTQKQHLLLPGRKADDVGLVLPNNSFKCLMEEAAFVSDSQQEKPIFPKLNTQKNTQCNHPQSIISINLFNIKNTGKGGGRKRFTFP